MVLPTFYGEADGIKLLITIIYLGLGIIFVLGHILSLGYLDGIVFTTTDLLATNIPYYNSMPSWMFPLMERFGLTWFALKSAYISPSIYVAIILLLVVGMRRPYTYPICISITLLTILFDTIRGLWMFISYFDSRNNFFVIARSVTPFVITNKNIEFLYALILQGIIILLAVIIVIASYSLKLASTKLVPDERTNGAIIIAGEFDLEDNDDDVKIPKYKYKHDIDPFWFLGKEEF